MSLQNRHGREVDPVPFAVTAIALALIVLSWGPGYLLAFGIPLATALVISGLTTTILIAGAYYRLVWTHRPAHRAHLSPAERLKHLAYIALAGALLIILLAIPLYPRLQ